MIFDSYYLNLRLIMKKFLTIIFIFAFCMPAISQQKIVQGVNAFRGRSVDFVFRSLNDISNGKSLGSPGVGFTEIYIKFDTVGEDNNMFLPEVTGWELCAYATTATLEADYGVSDMPLGEIKMHYTMTQGTGIIPAPNSFMSSDPANVIATGNIGDGAGDGTEWTVTIAYDCGKDSGTGLTTYDPDYFNTTLIYYLRFIYA